MILLSVCLGSCVTTLVFLQSVGAVRRRAQSEGHSGIIMADPATPCGPACVVLITHVLGKNTTISEVKALTHVDALGRTSMDELVHALKSLRLYAVGVRLAPNRLSELPIPAILHMQGGHFVVAVPNRSGSLLVLDPPRPPIEHSAEELAGDWSGATVLVARGNAALGEALEELGVNLD